MNSEIGDSEITQFLQSLGVEKKNVMFFFEQGATGAASTLSTAENCQLTGAIFCPSKPELQDVDK